MHTRTGNRSSQQRDHEGYQGQQQIPHCQFRIERREYLRWSVERACDVQMLHKATENSLQVGEQFDFCGFA